MIISLLPINNQRMQTWLLWNTKRKSYTIYQKSSPIIIIIIIIITKDKIILP